MGSEWQVGMLYLRCPVQDWLLNKAYLGKGWESALPREELKAKYTDLPGHLIMQILDIEVVDINWDMEDSSQVGPENAVLSLTRRTANSSLSTGSNCMLVGDILQWRTNSWVQHQATK